MSNKGTYIIVLQSDSDENIQIGKLGELKINPGIYVYVGSAFGPGGVPARIKHHQKISIKPHWHIDYLRAHTQYIKSFYMISEHRYEHEWAQQLSNHEGAIVPMKGFGSSDCNCQTHLFCFSELQVLKKDIAGMVEGPE